MGSIKKFNEYFKIDEGALEPVTRPTPAPTKKPDTTPDKTPGKKKSPLRRDKPSVEPGPLAVTDKDLANKFLNLTEDDGNIKRILSKKYNK